jgi:hypothetical protein
MGLVMLASACGPQSIDVGHDPAAGAGGGESAIASGGSDSLAAGGTTGVAAAGSGGVVTGGGGSLGDGTSTWVSPPPCDTDPGLESLLGTWQGDIEDFYLQPIMPLRLEIDAASAHGLCGTVTWGDVDPPAEPTDPKAAYPSAEFFANTGFGGGPNLLPAVQGFSYAIAQGAVRDRTVRFSTASLEPWRAWCELQKSYLSQGAWQCTPSYCAGEHASFQCNVCSPTFPLCQCDAAGCTANQAYSTPFDLTLSQRGDELTGPYSSESSPQTSAVAFYLKHVQ